MMKRSLGRRALRKRTVVARSEEEDGGDALRGRQGRGQRWWCDSVYGVRKRMEVACSEAKVEVVACSEPGDKAVACSGTGIDDDMRRW
jgi:hypothetical protein